VGGADNVKVLKQGSEEAGEVEVGLAV